jgi:AcrR family transcriptional regulator
MTRLKREESQARTRSLLIEAARTQVVTRGFAQASVRDIAEAAGFSQGAFYSNFDSKEALLLELLNEQKHTELDQLNGVLDSIADTNEALAALDTWVHAACGQREWAILAVELELHAARNAAFRTQYEALAQEHIAMVGKLVARIFKALKLEPPAPTRQLAAGFIALTHGLALQQPALSDDEWRIIYKTMIDGVIATAKRG